MAKKLNIYRLFMLISASSMATVSLFINFMPISVFGVVEYRGLFGWAWLTLFLILRGKMKVVCHILRYKKILVFLILTNTLTILFYFLSIKDSGAAVGAFLLYFGNIVALIFMKLIFHEKVTRLVLVSYIVAFTGIFFIMAPWNHGISIFGMLFGLLSALMLGLLNTFKKYIFKLESRMPVNRQLNKEELASSISWFVTLGLCLSFFFVFFIEVPVIFSLESVLGGMILGLIPTAIAFTLFNIAFQRDTGGNIFIVSYTEPLFATLIDIFIFKNLNIFVLIGGALVIFANLAVLYNEVNVDAGKGKTMNNEHDY
ncbi:MAG: DMT family transporter [Promethearchaeota archaeon]